MIEDADDCSSTRDSSNFTNTEGGIPGEEGGPWAVWRRWAADSMSEEGALSDIDSCGDSSSNAGASVASARGSMGGDSHSDMGSGFESDLSRRRSWTRRSARVSLAGYNCRGAVSVTEEETSLAADSDGLLPDRPERLSTIGEVLEMGM